MSREKGPNGLCKLPPRFPLPGLVSSQSETPKPGEQGPRKTPGLQPGPPCGSGPRFRASGHGRHSLMSHRPHLTDEETEAQKPRRSCPKSQATTTPTGTGPGSWAGSTPPATSLRQAWRRRWDWPCQVERGARQWARGSRGLRVARPWLRPGRRKKCGTRSRKPRSGGEAPPWITCDTSRHAAPPPVPRGPNHTRATCPRWPAAQTMKKNPPETSKSLSGRPCPVHICTCSLTHRLNFDARCDGISCRTERWQPWSSSCCRGAGMSPREQHCWAP